eukprot:scaffold32879_cov70-Phaeocystis_antarctica.AAC.2
MRYKSQGLVVSWYVALCVLRCGLRRRRALFRTRSRTGRSRVPRRTVQLYERNFQGRRVSLCTLQNGTTTRLEGARGLAHTARTLYSRSLSTSRRWPPPLTKAAADKGEERATLDSKTDPPARARARRTPRRASGGPRAGPSPPRARSRHPSARRSPRQCSR